MDHIHTEIINPLSLTRSPMGERRIIDTDRRDADLAVLKKACKDFESIFVHTLLKTMRKSLPKTETSSSSKDMVTSLGDLELARTIAHGRGIGLGEVLFEQLKHKVCGAGMDG